jgi:hypothetical protein
MSTATLVMCMHDADGCIYAAGSASCTNGACTGGAGAATCCVNACTIGQPLTCATGTATGTCVADGGNGCRGLAPMACGAGLVCKRYAPAVCVNADWAEWPMPNIAADVAAGAPHPASLTANQDGTVTDNVTGLMWQQTVSGGASTFSEAQQGCVALTTGGHTDWRLPTLIELVSIADYGRASAPALDPTAFPSASASGGYWSSTAGQASGNHRLVDFYDGSAGGELGAGSLALVRCVR